MEQETSDNYDSPWKDALADFLEPFLRLLFPEVQAQIDWTQEICFLETELRKLSRQASQGDREADALVEVGLHGGQRARLWIHIEVQNQRVGDFEQRMFVGHHRIRERFGGPVCSLAVIGDRSPNWRPARFLTEGFGCRLEFRYPIAKLADYRGRREELARSDNPFALVIEAHLLTQDSRRNPGLRVDFKVELTRSLYQRGFEQETIVKLFRLLDWMLHLEPPYALLFEEKLAQYQEEDRMPYITSFEQRGLEKGLEQGLEYLVEAIQSILVGRFGEVPTAVLESMNGLPAERLKELSLLAATADSVEAFQAGLNS